MAWFHFEFDWFRLAMMILSGFGLESPITRGSSRRMRRIPYLLAVRVKQLERN